MVAIYHTKDANPALIQAKRVTIIGYDYAHHTGTRKGAFLRRLRCNSNSSSIKRSATSGGLAGSDSGRFDQAHSGRIVCRS